MPKLLFIGSAVADVMLLLPALPLPGDDLHVLRQEVRLGGCAYNAFTAAQLTGRAECLLASPVGTGMWGDWVRQALARRGVTTLIPLVSEPNGCCYCLVTPDGERSFLCEHGAEYRFCREWLEALPTDADAVYICGLEVEEPGGDVLLDYLESHRPPQLYFAPGPRLCRIAPERMARIAAMRPLMHLSAREAMDFTRAEDPRTAAEMIFRLTGGDVVITLGPEGAYWRGADGEGLVRGCPVLPVDTTGAGDAHLGALMAARADGLSLPEAIARANRFAARVVQVTGGPDALIDTHTEDDTHEH